VKSRWSPRTEPTELEPTVSRRSAYALIAVGLAAPPGWRLLNELLGRQPQEGRRQPGVVGAQPRKRLRQGGPERAVQGQVVVWGVIGGAAAPPAPGLLPHGDAPIPGPRW
jgi:hypothetical protein